MEKKRAVALGFFDGVHIGHGALLSKTTEIAKEEGLSPCVMTYRQHPSAVLTGKSVPLITSPKEKASLIFELYGISDVVVKMFTKEYAELTCEDFFEKVLIEELNAGYVIAGFDFRFGAGAKGDSDKLRILCAEHNIGCEIVPAVMYGDEPVSSTRIRNYLLSGDVEFANELLGRSHRIFTATFRERGVGGKLGFPTINQHFEENVIIPKHGVYISRATLCGETFPAITNIGRRPTFGEDFPVVAETHILDFPDDSPFDLVKTELLHFLREEQKFDSPEALRQQISQDVAAAKRFF